MSPSRKKSDHLTAKEVSSLFNTILDKIEVDAANKKNKVLSLETMIEVILEHNLEI